MNRRRFIQAASALALAATQTPALGATAMTDITPFKLATPAAGIADLKARLAAARWPVEVAPESWERGVPGAALRQVAERWRNLDWTVVEADLNRYDQLMVEHEGELMHTFQIRSAHADATPLVLIHGWPSSGIEYLRIIDLLVNPTAHGGKATDAFHLVIPTQPGFGLSPAPRQAGWTSAKTAAAISKLLAALGYDRYGIHAADMGADVAGQLDVLDAGKVIGLHVGTETDTIVAVASFMGGDASQIPGLSDDQKARVAEKFAKLPDTMGYIEIQSTRPKTLGYALHDSPIGQLAWILEKFEAWTDAKKATVEEAVDIDQLLTNVGYYWFGGGGSASANAIWESFKAMGWAPPSNTPRAVAVFSADDLARPLMDPQGQVAHWTEFDVGGHFPAMEVPELLAADIRDFFAGLPR